MCDAFKDTKTWRQIATKIHYYRLDNKKSLGVKWRTSKDGKDYWEPDEIEKLLASVKKNGRDVTKAV